MSAPSTLIFGTISPILLSTSQLTKRLIPFLISHWNTGLAFVTSDKSVELTFASLTW